MRHCRSFALYRGQCGRPAPLGSSFRVSRVRFARPDHPARLDVQAVHHPMKGALGCPFPHELEALLLRIAPLRSFLVFVAVPRSDKDPVSPNDRRRTSPTTDVGEPVDVFLRILGLRQPGIVLRDPGAAGTARTRPILLGLRCD